MAFENFPYTNFHEINLDWIVAKVKEAYSASNPPDYPVKSVNGMTGDVIIAIPANLVSSVNGETGDVVLYRNPLTQFPATDEQRWNLFRICDGDERGIEFDEDGAHRIEGTRRILIYDEENQPEYPVTSVNGQTGDVRISAGVNSVNGKTGNVVTPFVNPNADILTLDSNSNTVLWGISRNVAGGNVALYISRGTGTPQAFIRYTPDQGEAVNLPLLSSADIPESSGVVSVNTKTGVVTLYGTDIFTTENGNTISQDISDLKIAISNRVSNNELFNGWTEYKPTYNHGWINSAGVYNPSDNRYISNAINTNDITEIVNNSQATVFIDCFSNFVDFNDYTFANYFSVAPGQSRRIDTTYPTICILIDSTQESEIDNIICKGPSILEYISKNQIDYLKTTNNTQNQQITALQNAYTTHDQQISALQNADTTINQQITTHDQQISALQAADTGHNQQISALQASQTTQDQQISALQAGQETQDQQISELYTRTGIYEIFIENVNSLPLRYPATGTDAKIKSTNIVVDMVVYISGVQASDWKINTYDGYLEITGTINGLSSITLYLA